jgi:hypothetical protein
LICRVYPVLQVNPLTVEEIIMHIKRLELTGAGRFGMGISVVSVMGIALTALKLLGPAG